MTRPLTLFHVSDIHFGHHNHAALEWFADAVAQQKPDWVICTGDVAMRGNAHEYAAAAHWLGALAAPVSLEIGNHDVPYYWYLRSRIVSPYKRFRALDALVGQRPDLASASVTSLRTVAAFQWRLNLSKGRVSPADLKKALGDLERNRAKRLRLVACHHPLVDADTRSSGSTRNGRKALAALAHAGADAVLSGHVHDAFDLEVEAGGRPIRLIGAGTLSRRERGSPPSYNRLEWSTDKGLVVTACRMD